MRILTIILYTYAQQNENTHIKDFFMLVKNIRELQYTHIALDQENRLYLIGYKLHIIIFLFMGRLFLMDS